MKTFRNFPPILALPLLAAFYSSSISGINDLASLSSEIGFMLRNSEYNVPYGENVNVSFSIAADKTIQYVTVASDDERVNHFLQKKLKGWQLDGCKWREGTIYELSVNPSLDTLMVYGKVFQHIK